MVKARNVAVGLYANLHSAAGENIISSLLAASLNESSGLRKWLLRKTELDSKIDVNRLHAAANDTIPEQFRGEPRKGKRRYGHTDVLLWNREEQRHWDILEDSEKSTTGKKQAAKKIHAVFVEVKRESLSKEDKNKYMAFVKHISKHYPRLRFVIISCHYPSVMKRIRNEIRCGRDQDERWRVLLERDGVIYINIEEILHKLGNNHENCQILPIFTEYIRLLITPTSKEYWKDRLNYYYNIENFDDYSGIDYSGIREEIASTLIGLAKRAGCLIQKRRRIIDSISIVEKGSSYTLQFNKEKQPRKHEFIVRLSDKKAFTFNLKDNLETVAEDVSRKIKKLNKIFESL